ncbi:GGDEF domain-containing protein [Sulfurimonas sp. CS5]|uniref:GGDEF domain-containing protein n=1 Tax=Sulfurimonas sp. CS5 TaxID=3391145 RepID=UPI0039ECA37B
MKAITNIYNSFIHTNTLATVFILTFFSILASFFLVMFILIILDITVGAESISYYNIGVILSLIIPTITTPILSYKLIVLTNKLKQAEKKPSYHVQYDELTKIYNKRHTLELANYEFAISKRTKSPISALFIEYDQLKKVNEKYGKKIGDIVLIEFTRSINNNIRTTDIFGRYKGAKFLLIFPMLDLNTTQKLAKKIKTEVEQVIHINNDDIKISVHIGCAQIQSFGESTLQTLIDMADIDLLKAKNSTINKVQI